MGWLPRPSAPAMATLATPVTEGGRDRAVKGGPSFSDFLVFVISVSGPCVCPIVTALSVFFIRPEYMLPFTVFPLSYTFDASQRDRFDLIDSMILDLFIS